jgi:hypothetical protein
MGAMLPPGGRNWQLISPYWKLSNPISNFQKNVWEKAFFDRA